MSVDYRALLVGLAVGYVAGRAISLYPVERTFVTIERALTGQPTVRDL